MLLLIEYVVSVAAVEYRSLVIELIYILTSHIIILYVKWDSSRNANDSYNGV